MDWLIIGSGTIANAYMRYLPDAVQMRRPDHDLRNIEAVPATDNGTAVICASVTGFRTCSMFPDWSQDVNVKHTLRVARICHDYGWNVVMLSSQAAANPQNDYGWQKATVEAKWTFGPILRLPKIVHRELPLFWSWRHELSNGRIIRPFVDSTIQPILTENVVDATKAIAHLRGLMFEAPGPETTWFHLAYDLARSLGYNPDLVRPQNGGTTHPLMTTATIRNTGWRKPTYENILNALL